VTLAPPPNPLDLDPLVIEIAAGTPVVRIHSMARSADAFNPGLGRPSRFAPLRRADGALIPTLNAATSVAAALSESVFHDVPYRGRGKRILAGRLTGLALSTVIVAEPIRLAMLAGLGLRRLGIRRRELIESGPGSYSLTTAWALALYGCPAAPFGLLWTSRQDDTASSLLLFGDRVSRPALLVASDPVPLDLGPGLALVDDAATLAGITVVR
jgi:RES domain-containing protein